MERARRACPGRCSASSGNTECGSRSLRIQIGGQFDSGRMVTTSGVTSLGELTTALSSSKACRVATCLPAVSSLFGDDRLQPFAIGFGDEYLFVVHITSRSCRFRQALVERTQRLLRIPQRRRMDVGSSCSGLPVIRVARLLVVIADHDVLGIHSSKDGHARDGSALLGDSWVDHVAGPYHQGQISILKCGLMSSISTNRS